MSRIKVWLKSIIKPIKIPIYNTINSEMLLKDKVALILGGDGGIGFAIAKKLIKSGAKVIISGRSEKKLKECCDKLGTNAKCITFDLNNIKNFDEKITMAALIFNKIDILINSAGIHIDKKNYDFLNVSEEDYDKIMSTNLKGVYFISQSISKYWIKNNIKGHILFISSQSALEPAWSPYRLSKNCLRYITEGLAQKLIQYNIVVNGIGPGPTATDMQNYKKGSTIFTDDNNINRYTIPEEIAEYAVLMVSDLGNTIIGQTIYMSGGRGIIDKR